jgi:hypothetical protein
LIDQDSQGGVDELIASDHLPTQISRVGCCAYENEEVQTLSEPGTSLAATLIDSRKADPTDRDSKAADAKSSANEPEKTEVVVFPVENGSQSISQFSLIDQDSQGRVDNLIASDHLPTQISRVNCCACENEEVHIFSEPGTSVAATLFDAKKAGLTANLVTGHDETDDEADARSSGADLEPDMLVACTFIESRDVDLTVDFVESHDDANGSAGSDNAANSGGVGRISPGTSVHQQLSAIVDYQDHNVAIGRESPVSETPGYSNDLFHGVEAESLDSLVPPEPHDLVSEFPEASSPFDASPDRQTGFPGIPPSSERQESQAIPTASARQNKGTMDDPISDQPDVFALAPDESLSDQPLPDSERTEDQQPPPPDAIPAAVDQQKPDLSLAASGGTVAFALLVGTFCLSWMNGKR